jgi:hypothetical protein
MPSAPAAHIAVAGSASGGRPALSPSTFLWRLAPPPLLLSRMTRGSSKPRPHYPCTRLACSWSGPASASWAGCVWPPPPSPRTSFRINEGLQPGSSQAVPLLCVVDRVLPPDLLFLQEFTLSRRGCNELPNSARQCSLAGRYDSPIPTRFLSPIDCLKIRTQRVIK